MCFLFLFFKLVFSIVILNYSENISNYNANDNYRIKKGHTYPLSIFYVIGAKSIYFYSIEAINTSNGETVCGSFRIPVVVTYKLNKGLWRVADIYEAP